MDLKKQRAEIAVTSLILAIAGYLQYVAYTSKERTKVQGMRSMTFPKAILYVIMALCLIVLVRGVIQYVKLRRQEKSAPAVREKGGFPAWLKTIDIRIPLSVGLFILYAAMWNVVGFVISSFLFFLAESLLLDRGKPWWHALLIAVVYVAVVYLIFSVGFKVRFPEPILEELFG